MCSKHRVAELWKLHHKYGTIKKVIAKFNDHCDNIEDYDLLEKCRNEGIGESDRKIIRNKNGITAKIVAKVSIIGVARRYGIDVRKNKAVCPFHADRNPSLSFDDTNGLFYCFGCCNGGNIIDFLSKCKEQGLKKIEIKNG
ncbi:hypothetical protein CMI42_00370 [Candidatus Pacearchaeota archaeon]|nr:hypothetical protein [Candidatus Pacearchaeota archaeon]